MSHVIITGATGLCGSAVLKYANACPDITRISVLSRRPVQLAEGSSKTSVFIHSDFENYSPELLAQIKDATGCIWAQGIATKGIPKEDYTRITVDYPLPAAEAFASVATKQMNFVYLSSEGADMREKMPPLFCRIKGRAERMLLEAQATHSSLRVFNVRPGFFTPRGQGDRWLEWRGAVLAVVWKKYEIPIDALAKVLVDLAIGDGRPIAAGVGIEADGRVLRNYAIRRLSGL